MFARLENGDGGAGAAGAARAADAVHVRLVGGGNAEVDDVRKVFKVDAAGGDVGRHDGVDLAGAGALHDAVAGRLVKTAVKGLDAEAAGAKRFREVVHLHAGAREDDGELGGLEVEDAAERGRAVVVAHDVGDLRDAGRFAFGSLFLGDRDADRVDEAGFGDAGDLRGQRGGEESRLHVAGKGVEDGVELVGKAQIEHFVGFVKHDGLDVREVERAAADVVERAARRGDDDVRATAQGTDLAAVVLTAVDRGHEHAGLAAVVVERLAHLQAEFTGRGENEDERRIGFLTEHVALKERKREGGGLARARGGAAEHVGAGQEGGNGLVLNGGGFLEAEFGQGGNDGVGQAEFGESRHEFVLKMF